MRRTLNGFAMKRSCDELLTLAIKRHLDGGARAREAGSGPRRPRRRFSLDCVRRSSLKKVSWSKVCLSAVGCAPPAARLCLFCLLWRRLLSGPVTCAGASAGRLWPKSSHGLFLNDIEIRIIKAD